MFFGLFLGPVLALVLFNAVVFVLVIRVLVKHSVRKLEDVDRKKKAIGTVKTLVSVVSIMLMFGLQWLFGAFTIAEASEAFQWLFVIFASLQGFFLFLFFCLLSQDAREEWLNLFSLGMRNKKKRGVFASNVSQTGRGRNTGSTYITSKHSRTMKRNVLASSGLDSESGVEMKSKRSLYLAAPISSSVSEAKETEFVITNGNAADHVNLPTVAEERMGDIEKVDMTTESDSKQPSVEVPPYILERRFMRRHDPAAEPRLLGDVNEGEGEEDEEEETEGEGGEGSLVSSEGSTTCYDVSIAEFGGELTQMTDMSTYTNSDVSDVEELSHL